MCRLVIVLSIILCALLIPCAVEAATSVDVIITATGIVVAPPTGFTVSYVSDFETHLSWIAPANSMATMVRAAYGHVPTSMTDGYLVYQGAGNSFNDTAASLTSPDVIYYRAWSQRNDGIWGSLYAETDTEDLMSLSFLFIGIIILILAAFGLATAGFVTKRKLLLALAGLLAIIIAITCGSTTNFPMSNQLIIFALIFAVAMFMSPIYFREKKAAPLPPVSHMQHMTDYADAVRASRNRFKERVTARRY